MAEPVCCMANRYVVFAGIVKFKEVNNGCIAVVLTIPEVVVATKGQFATTGDGCPLKEVDE